MIQASAPAKVILFGEHAVVYGKPAIAVPISSLRAVATVDPNVPPLGYIRVIAEDIGQALSITMADDVDNALSLAARKVIELTGSPLPDVTISLRSSIPIAGGLGSGAAVTTALVRALAAAINAHLENAAINQIVFEVEKLFHGTPSGIDNTVIVYEQPIYFVRGQIMQPFLPSAPVHLVIADTGITASTKVSVGDVRTLFERNPERTQVILDDIGDIVDKARHALENGSSQQLGSLMVQNHELLRQLTVSSPELDRLVEAAIGSGALGAKLSGGGRGGNMIALVTPETRSQVMAALRNAGATNAFATTVGS